MEYVAGAILTPEGFVEGYVGFEDNLIVEVERGEPPTHIAKGIVTPTLINSHTHVADLRVPVDLSLSLEELVAPPDGLKHRMLSSMSKVELRDVFREASEFMFQRGVSTFADFRESGIEGSRLLYQSDCGGALPVIMGRPMDLKFDREEMISLLSVVNGVGISSISDWNYSELMEVAELTHQKGKMFALHASERLREDIDLILDLKPDYLVHMTMATDSDLEICSDHGLPVVVCPRSNLFYGRKPPLARMLDAGVTIALGTDNAMISLPDMLTEMEFAGRILRQQGFNRVDPVLHMALCNGRKILNLNETIGIQPGSPCDLLVVGPRRGEAVTDFVLRSGSANPLLVIKGKTTRREPR
ncbi:MAG: amidohydrolase family protein [Methanomassiliicoccales archaeon]|nr:amidohydrolase family protein [Methanomassiliicoccales archaeon]NYT15363.1 amidohydrolase family protein [Methanomassiliicoccales archaeon]